MHLEVGDVVVFPHGDPYVMATAADGRGGPSVPEVLAFLREMAAGRLPFTVAEGGAGPEHLVRLTWYLADRHEYNARLTEIGAAYREIVGRHFPAMTAVQVAGFVEEGVKVEIEATAVVP